MVLLTSAMNVFVKTFVFEINELRNKKKKPCQNCELVSKKQFGEDNFLSVFQCFHSHCQMLLLCFGQVLLARRYFLFFPSLSALISYITLGYGTLICSFEPDGVSIIFGYQSVSSQDKLMVNNFSKWVEIYCSIHFYSFLILA